MRLYLMRHAEAGEADARRWPDDRQRPLSERGHREHALVAVALARMGVRFDRLLTSPLVRARQTAEITAAAYGGVPRPRRRRRSGTKRPWGSSWPSSHGFRGSAWCSA